MQKQISQQKSNGLQKCSGVGFHDFTPPAKFVLHRVTKDVPGEIIPNLRIKSILKVQLRFIAWRQARDLMPTRCLYNIFTAGTHPQPLPGRRPSGCRRLFYPRWRCRRGQGRQGKTSGTVGPWRPPSGGPSWGQRGDGLGSGAPWGWACSQLPWSSGRPGWGRCLVWQLARAEPVILISSQTQRGADV